MGWNEVEFEGLGESFSNRGVRSEEQMQLLRALWTNPSIVFDGQWDQVVDAGLNPMPVQQPIPIWIGGYAESTLRRIAKFGDGWFPWRQPDEEMTATLERLWAYTREAGRDPSEIGLEPKLDITSGSPDAWHAFVEGWRRLGATHLCVNTMGAGYRTPGEHICGARAGCGGAGNRDTVTQSVHFCVHYADQPEFTQDRDPCIISSADPPWKAYYGKHYAATRGRTAAHIF